MTHPQTMVSLAMGDPRTMNLYTEGRLPTALIWRFVRFGFYRKWWWPSSCSFHSYLPSDLNLWFFHGSPVPCLPESEYECVGVWPRLATLKRYLKQNNVSKVITKRPGRLEMITAVMSSWALEPGSQIKSVGQLVVPIYIIIYNIIIYVIDLTLINHNLSWLVGQLFHRKATNPKITLNDRTFRLKLLTAWRATSCDVHLLVAEVAALKMVLW